jgi:hypothetical protein
VVAPVTPDASLEVGREGGEDEPLDERSLARADPLSALLLMRLPERAAYLLGTARVAAAVDPLLSILIRCVRLAQRGCAV